MQTNLAHAHAGIKNQMEMGRTRGQTIKWQIHIPSYNVGSRIGWRLKDIFFKEQAGQQWSRGATCGREWQLLERQLRKTTGSLVQHNRPRSSTCRSPIPYRGCRHPWESIVSKAFFPSANSLEGCKCQYIFLCLSLNDLERCSCTKPPIK